MRNTCCACSNKFTYDPKRYNHHIIYGRKKTAKGDTPVAFYCCSNVCSIQVHLLIKKLDEFTLDNPAADCNEDPFEQ